MTIAREDREAAVKLHFANPDSPQVLRFVVTKAFSEHRESASARVSTWLREIAKEAVIEDAALLGNVADAIERGEHLP